MAFPYRYYFYGSSNSVDTDVLIQVDKQVMPQVQEERKILLRNLELEYHLNWNTNLIVVENGIIIDTIYPKSWVDSLNNSLYVTYNLHEQEYENPINSMVKRNILLAIYKAVRTVLSLNSRTDKRPLIRPFLNGIHDFKLKLKSLKSIDLRVINSFNQKNFKDIDIWKTISFYVGQNVLLIEQNIEIYTKNDLLKYYPELSVYINRFEYSYSDLNFLQSLLDYWINLVENYGIYISQGERLSCNNEFINMKNETF
jgi:hypothetical protein